MNAYVQWQNIIQPHSWRKVCTRNQLKTQEIIILWRDLHENRGNYLCANTVQPTRDRVFTVAGPRACNSLLPAKPSIRSLHSKKNCFFIDSHFGRDNVNIDYVKRSSNSVYHIIALNKLS